MLKRLSMFLLSFMMIFTITGCGPDTPDDDEGNTEQTEMMFIHAQTPFAGDPVIAFQTASVYHAQANEQLSLPIKQWTCDGQTLDNSAKFEDGKSYQATIEFEEPEHWFEDGDDGVVPKKEEVTIYGKYTLVSVERNNKTWKIVIEAEVKEANIMDHEHEMDGINETTSTFASCEKDGYIFHTCGIEGCDYKEIEHQDAYGHDFKKLGKTVKPDCEKAVTVKGVCENCGKEMVQTLPATGHQLVTKIKTPATCTHAGEEVRECKVCHKTITKTYPQTNHVYGNAEYAGNYRHKKVCKFCSDTITEGCIPDSTEHCKVCGHTTQVN